MKPSRLAAQFSLNRNFRMTVILILILFLSGLSERAVFGATGAATDADNIVRLDGHALRDKSGPFLGLGASYFQALRRAKFERTRFESDVQFLASKKFNYVRVLSMVGWFKGWDGLEMAAVDFKCREDKE